MKPIVQKHKSAINIISFVIQKDEKGVKELLRKNGVDTSFILGKKQLAKVVIEAMAKSKTFTNDFIKYVEEKKKTPFSNVNGSVSLSGSGGGTLYDYNSSIFDTTTDISDLANSDPLDTAVVNDSGSASSSTTNTSGGFFSGVNFNDLLNSGIKILEMQKEIEVSQNERDTVTGAVQLQQDKQNYAPQTKSNSGTLIWLGVGVLIVGGLTIYFIKKGK